MSAYSFLSVKANIVGIGGAFDLASDAGADKEGITIEPNADKNVMVEGADGSVMHSLQASTSAKVSVKLLKTSPVNAMLQTMYNLQTSSAALWGNNVITLRDVDRGDLIVLSQVAFKRQPNLAYGAEAGVNEWQFDAGKVTTVLGVGTPEI
jgi:hypothetical protein